MRIDTGCDSSAAFKALVSPPPVLSAETRSFEDVVAGYAGQLQLRCDGCNQMNTAQVVPQTIRATRGDFTQLPQPWAQHDNCTHGDAMCCWWQNAFSLLLSALLVLLTYPSSAPELQVSIILLPLVLIVVLPLVARFLLPKHDGGGSHQIHPHHMSSWQEFFDAAWASLKALDDHEQAMAAHCSRSIFTLV